MAPRIIFHIGLEKTGTDSFQRYCSESRREFLARGILYPVEGLAFAEQSHGPLAACYLPYRDLSIGPRSARGAVLRSLEEQIDRAKPQTVLISAEHFSSRFREAEIERLARDFAGYPCRIAVVVREHESRIRSAYAQWIVAGRSLSFEDYCDEIFDPGSRYARYRETIAPWDRVFGRDNMRLLSLARGSNVIGMLCAALIPQAAGLRAEAAYRDNPSPGDCVTAALRQVNLVLPSQDPRRGGAAGRIKWLLLRLARHRIRGLIEAAAGDRPRGRFHLSAKNRVRLEEIAGADRQWLEECYGIRLETPGAEPDAPPDEALAKRLADRVMARPWVRFLAALR